LGLYDAAYLILAIARAGTLASRDFALLDAAKSQIANRHPDTRTICC
jgi:predicted nucleic acid-binding protein